MLKLSRVPTSLCKLVQCSHRSCQRDARRPSPRPSLPPHQCLYLITTPARRLCAGNQLGDNVEHLVTWSAPARSLMNKQAQRGVLKQRKRERKKYPKSTSYHGPLWPPLLRLVVQPSTSPPLVVRVILVDVASVSHSFTSCTHPPLDSFGSSQYQQTFCRKLPNPYMQLAPMYLCISRVLQSNCLLDPTCHRTCVWSHT